MKFCITFYKHLDLEKHFLNPTKWNFDILKHFRNLKGVLFSFGNDSYLEKHLYICRCKRLKQIMFLKKLRDICIYHIRLLIQLQILNYTACKLANRYFLILSHVNCKILQCIIFVSIMEGAHIIILVVNIDKYYSWISRVAQKRCFKSYCLDILLFSGYSFFPQNFSHFAYLWCMVFKRLVFCFHVFEFSCFCSSISYFDIWEKSPERSTNCGHRKAWTTSEQDCACSTHKIVG